jgi:LuxR family transcriptional regulator, maltose regulon positive regulatory protein
MGTAVQSGTADVPGAAALRGGVVCRRTLFGRLEQAGRVVQVSAPAGSGKTVLLRSWIGEAGLADSCAWVSVEAGEHDPQRFWVSLADGLRGTIAGSKLVRPLTAAPDLNGWAVVKRLLEDLGSLEDRLWLVIDDLHELRSADALAQLESLVMRAPPELRFVLSARQELRLALHRLRLEGELTEIRPRHLRFTLDEARAMFDAAGAELTGSALAQLHARTEGWAAGLRLALQSLSGHPDPERFASEFPGTERTVAEYLQAEVLDRQVEPVRRLLLRTSICERVSGELADVLTGASRGEQILQELADAGTFVVSLDAARSWFRYHPLFADLLQLQLRRSGPDELAGLHGAAARWYAGHGHPVEAVRHAQSARDWDLAARLLCDQWLGLALSGRSGTAHQLLARFPAGAVAADAELTALMGAALGLWLARQRGDPPAVKELVQRLLAAAEDPDATRLGICEDLCAKALISLGLAEVWTTRSDGADLHPEQGIALARRIGRPYLEVTGRAYGAIVASIRSYSLAEEWNRQAIELAPRHGGAEEQVVGGRTAPEVAPPEPLTDSETRVLRYLTSHLTAPEIAGHLYLPVHTVTTHLRHIYAKLGVHRRCEAVDRARALGLLAPSSATPPAPSRS